MINSKIKREYGDFQTPVELAIEICQKLVTIGVNPEIIIEPTCGLGNFLKASALVFSSAKNIIGWDINPDYIHEIEQNYQYQQDDRIVVKQQNFFEIDWQSFQIEIAKNILIIGNFPWITNSQQGLIAGNNLPGKNNFQNHKGWEAVTGKSNFDISEWMLIETVKWLQKRHGYLAMLCKNSVARKILNYIYYQKLNLQECASYSIEAQKYFGVSVDACLLFCQFDANSQNYYCDVFNSLKAKNFYRIGYQDKFLVKDLINFQKLRNLAVPPSGEKWRSGIKHDCAKVMEIKRSQGKLVNGLGEIVEIEDTCLFPLLKGSDIIQGRTQKSDRYLLITQKTLGYPTDYLQQVAPLTWHYLNSHSHYLDQRKSKIYQHQPRFSIFGVGYYTFLPWKIAICGLDKKLNFRLIGPLNHQATVFDDTVYFLAFEDEQAARNTLRLLTSSLAIDFYSSLIFWDEKRPIKASILNSLNLVTLASQLESLHLGEKAIASLAVDGDRS